MVGFFFEKVGCQSLQMSAHTTLHFQTVDQPQAGYQVNNQGH